MNMDLDAVVHVCVCIFQVAASHFGHRPLVGWRGGQLDGWTLYSPNCPVLFLLLYFFFLEMHNWVLMHMPTATASSITPVCCRHASWKEKYLSDYSAELYECVIVLLELTASPIAAFFLRCVGNGSCFFQDSSSGSLY